MLRTVEATFDPASGVHFLEPVGIDKPVRILVTFMEAPETVHPSSSPAKSALAAWLDSPAPADAGRTAEEIERYIQEQRSSWDS